MIGKQIKQWILPIKDEEAILVRNHTSDSWEQLTIAARQRCQTISYNLNITYQIFNIVKKDEQGEYGILGERNWLKIKSD